MTQDRLATFFLQLSVFLIPSSLAFRIYEQEAFIRGRLVDYLLPRIYLTDITLLLFIIFILINKENFNLFKGIIKKYSSLVFFLGSFWLLLFVTSIVALAPASALWYLLRLTLMGFAALSVYIWLQFHSSRKLILPLILLIIFQSTLALYQFVTQSSLASYVFLGEPSLSSSPAVVKSAVFGRVMILPYGTTPHPNVLAGVITVSILLYFMLYIYNPNLKINKSLSVFIICLLLTIILATQSVTSLLALTIVNCIVIATRNSRKRVVTYLVIASSVAISMLITLGLYHSKEIIDNRSITRRYMLISTSMALFKNDSLVGVGLDNFVPAANQTAPLSQDPAIFLQPVHNIYLLWLTETGFMGFASVVWLLYQLIKVNGLTSRIPPLLPLLALGIIGVFDHWPLTLQPGLMLLSITGALSIALPKDNVREMSG